MAKKPQAEDLSSSSASTSPSSAPPSGGPSTHSNEAVATDSIDGEVKHAPAPAPAPAPVPSLSYEAPSGAEEIKSDTPLSGIASPEHAVNVLKEKVHALHTVVNNVANFKTLAFNEAEQLMADIKYLTSYIRSKV